MSLWEYYIKKKKEAEINWEKKKTDTKQWYENKNKNHKSLLHSWHLLRAKILILLIKQAEVLRTAGLKSGNTDGKVTKIPALNNSH